MLSCICFLESFCAPASERCASVHYCAHALLQSTVSFVNVQSCRRHAKIERSDEPKHRSGDVCTPEEHQNKHGRVELSNKHVRAPLACEPHVGASLCSSSSSSSSSMGYAHSCGRAGWAPSPTLSRCHSRVPTRPGLLYIAESNSPSLSPSLSLYLSLSLSLFLSPSLCTSLYLRLSSLSLPPFLPLVVFFD